MHALWKDYFALLMEFEGETLTNDPADPGGATKYGIDQRSNPSVNIATLTKAGAERLYLAEWAKSAASRLPAPVSFAYFDLAVNAGETQAARCLQRALGLKRVDGVAGPVTIAAANAMIANGKAGTLVARLSSQRELFYLNLTHTRPKLTKFLRGWLRRTKAMQRWALSRLTEEGAQ